MLFFMNRQTWVLIVLSLIFITSLVGACGNITPNPPATATTTASLSPIPPATSSHTPTAIPLPTNTSTATPEPGIAPNCRIANEEGQLYLLSDQEFRDLGTTAGKVDRALAAHYPEWANYAQPAPWSTEPVKLGEIIVSASLDEESNLQINPAVTLVTLGDSLNWQLPSNTDLYLKSQEISIELNRLSLDWDTPQNESLRSQYPEVTNSGTYALYAFFNFNLDRLQTWQETYRGLFGEEVPQANSADIGTLQTADLEPFLALPFEHPETKFWTVNSFFDHQSPLYDDDTAVDILYRFDGKFIQKDVDNGIYVSRDECSLTLTGATCYSGHDGIDYDLSLGEPVLAAAAGTVITWDRDTGTVIIRHANGLLTIYMHMSAVYVDPDDPTKNTVNQGDVIGEAGEEGNASGPHLHFGVRQPDHQWKDIDPFGWQSLDPDPWSTYPTYGQTSTWLWKGDESGDGYLTVDNRESQAQFFLPPSSIPPDPPQIGWHRLTSGYDGEAWYSFMHSATDDLHKYWAIWGSTIEQPGEYTVQAYWPEDPDPGDEWQPASNAQYTLYYHQNGALQKTFLYGNQTAGSNQFNPLCKVELAGGNCPADQVAHFTFEQGSTTLILENPALYDTSQHRRILFYDAVQWQPYTPPTPTPTPTTPPVGARGFYPNGIHVKYYNDVPPAQYYLEQPINWNTFTTLAAEDDVQAINFNWGTTPPAPNVNGTFWSARYEGPLFVPQTGAYVFYLDNLDDGGRLFIDGINLIDSWRVQGPHFYSANVQLAEGQHSIKIEYAQGPGSQGSITVAWELPGVMAKEVIGSAGMATSTPPTPIPTTPVPTTPVPTTAVPTTPPPACNCIIDWFCPQPGAQAVQLRSLSLPDSTGTPMPSNMELSADAGTASVDPVARASLIYRVRDELMSNATEGQRLTDLYYDHSLEIATLMLADGILYDQGFAALDAFLPGLQALVDGNGGSVTVTAEQVAAAQAFLDALSSRASPELQQAIQQERANNPLENMVGLTMSQAWSYISGSFPSTGILDNFNRANGSIGSNWSGNTSSYNIYANKLLVKSRNSNLDIYWNNNSFGPNQEAYFTFSSVRDTAIDQDLILKAQSMSGWGDGMIVVQYDASAHQVVVWTYDHMQSWVEHGAGIPVTFVNGDQFGVRALANGTLEIYRNGVLLGTRNISAWPHNAKSGYVGLWFGNAKDVQVDDFGGGTIP